MMPTPNDLSPAAVIAAAILCRLDEEWSGVPGRRYVCALHGSGSRASEAIDAELLAVAPISRTGYPTIAAMRSALTSVAHSSVSKGPATQVGLIQYAKRVWAHWTYCVQ